MATPTHDLSQVRLRLTKMTDRILMRLHDRSGFPLNRAVYEVGAKTGRGVPDRSLLDFAVEGLEAYHASLGRFDFPDQFPMTSKGTGTAGHEAVRRVEIALWDDLVRFYTREVLPKLCTDADDPDCYGETAYVDADLLVLLNERINIGRDVALAKLEREPDLQELLANESLLKERLTDRPREDAVVAEAVKAGERYGVDGQLAEFVFRWVIATTLDLEVEFLRKLPA